MSTKIKITESQLKNIMKNNIKEQHEGDVEESAAGGVGLSKSMDLTDKLNSMTASYIRQVKAAISENGFGDTQERYDELLTQLNMGLREDDGEVGMGQGEPMNKDIDMGGVPTNRDVDMEGAYFSRQQYGDFNESIEKIKSEFQRYL